MGEPSHDGAASGPKPRAPSGPDPTTAPPAAPEPVAPEPVASAPPAAAPQPPAAALQPPAPAPKQPSAFRRVIVPLFWAGLLGGGVFLWLLGLVVTVEEARLVSWMHGDAVLKPLVLLILGASIGAGLSLGFTTSIRSYASLLGRIFGSLVFGSGLAFFAAYQVHETILRGHPSAERVEGMAVAGALMMALPIAQLHGRRIRDALRDTPATRWKAAGVAGALLLVTVWPLSPSLRCRLGQGEGCRRAGSAAERSGDQQRATDLFEQGCDDDDRLACRLAAAQYQAPARGMRRDLDRAEELLRDACILGDDTSCGRVHALILERRCDRYAASACRELAEVCSSGSCVDGSPAITTRLFQKACLLGDEDACRRAR